MFIDFFYLLRRRGVPVATQELLDLLQMLSRGLDQQSLDRFYILARSVMVKRVEHYDLWDEVFYEFFHDRPFSSLDLDAISDEVMQWLEDPRQLRELTEEEKQALEELRREELLRQLQQRLEEQTERHDGGNKWVGTGGTSPFGHSGYHPTGVKIAPEGAPSNAGPRGGGAIAAAQARNFKSLRHDLKLDVRSIGVALKKLKLLTRDGRPDELDVDATIEATGKNAGDLELIFRAPRKNRVKLMLLMDVGGSMTPYSRLCSRLFSAAHQASHFKQFESYYFHNCPYGVLYEDMSQRKYVETREVFAKLDQTWRVIVVGDAAMAPDELMYAGGAIDLYHLNQRSGLSWLLELKELVPSSVWINPDPERYWEVTYTTRRIREIFEMFPLTLDGLDDAIATLRQKGV